jgi:hypothetical protein
MTIFGQAWPLDRPLARAALMLVVLFLLLPPDGVLLDNEENYFQLAAQAVSGRPASPDSAVFDASRHRVVSETLLGNLIALAGFEAAQVVTRALAAVAFALLLPAVFRLISLSALDGVIVVVVFALLGQTVVGGEWLLHGFEAKVVAYGFVLAALHAAYSRRGLVATTALATAATYFHFLIGIFWFFALLALRLIARRQEIARVAIAAVAFVAATAPLTATIVLSRLEDAATGAAAAGPSPDVIYSLIREPWHAAPFLDPVYFVQLWLPGYLLAAAMLAGSIVVARTCGEARLRAFALWLAALIAYLFLALVPAFLERHTGAVGKFYPFRPSSLVLLLWLALAIAWLNGLGARHLAAVKLLALALVAPAFLNATLSRIAADMTYRDGLADDKSAVAAYLAAESAPGAVVLVDPAIEASFLDFERRTRHPSLVMWKFTPTNDRDLREWYRRLEFRQALFEKGCKPEPLAYRVDFLLLAPGSTAAAGCGRTVLESEHWRLLRRAVTP